MVDRARASDRGAYSSRVIRKAQPDVGQFRPHECRVADHRRHQAGGALDRHQLRISAHHREDRIQSQPVGAGIDLVRQGPLSVHRADLARHHEERAGRPTAMATMPTPFHVRRTGATTVADPTMRAEIMRLRSDPAASAMMAGSFTRSNAEQLRSAIGRQPSEGELYIAHFLGPGGAAKMIGAATSQPRANAADMFPQAAAANPSIFYDASGRPRSVGDVYGKLTGRFETARALSFAPGTRAADRSISARPSSSIARAADRSDASAPPIARHRRRHAGLCAGQRRCRRCRTPSRCSSRCSPTARGRR